MERQPRAMRPCAGDSEYISVIKKMTIAYPRSAAVSLAVADTAFAGIAVCTNDTVVSIGVLGEAVGLQKLRALFGPAL